MKSLIFTLLFFFSFNFANGEELSKEDLFNIIRSANNISDRRASLIVMQLQKTYGFSESGKLNISGVLVGSRTNYSLFKDRKVWNFSASFIPSGSKKVLTIPDLIEAEYFNGGIKATLISKDWAVIVLPKGMSISDLQGLETNRGVSISAMKIAMSIAAKLAPSLQVATGLLLPMWAVDLNLGLTDSKLGRIGIVQGSVGFNFNLISFPKFIFKINEKHLARVEVQKEEVQGGEESTDVIDDAA